METRSQYSRVAVLGAGGFVGSRLFEILASEGDSRWVPFLRSARSYARLGKLGIASVKVDSSDPDRLASALAGYDSLVNLTLGESHRIASETAVFYEACRRAGVRLFVHTSSSVVFDRLTTQGITDDSPPDVRNWNLYARQKAAAEMLLARRWRDAERPVVVGLRPGLIWGPRSPWSHRPAMALDRGQVPVANAGIGVCNLVHVDNLVRCIRQVVDAPSPVSGFYSISDPGLTSWGQFYRSLARGLGYPESRIVEMPPGPLPVSKATLAEWLKQRTWFYALTRWLIPRLSGPAKSRLKAILPALAGGAFVPPAPIDAGEGDGPLPNLTREVWSLHSTERKLPLDRFVAVFGDPRLMGHEEALRSTLSWLRYAGFGKGEE